VWGHRANAGSSRIIALRRGYVDPNSRIELKRFERWLDVERAAGHLHGMIEELKQKAA
jgi:hypothetical protein